MYLKNCVSLFLRGILTLCFLPGIFYINCSKSPQSVSEFPRAEVKDYKGVPTLYINGQPNAGMTYMTYNTQEKHYRQFGEIGVNLASFQTTANYNLYWHEPPVWVNRDSFDYSLLDKEMELIVRANPNVWIFPRVYLWSPEWWDKENPDELMRYQDGTTERPKQHGGGEGWKSSHPAWASEKWRKDTAYCLRKFIEHVRSKEYGKRVIGYHLASGGTEEWVYWNFDKDFLDYSIPQTNAFRNYLRLNYDTDKKLQEAWQDKNVTFATATIPSGERRLATDLKFFRDPKKSRQIIDYNYFHSALIAETIAYFAHVVKEVTKGENLVGAFYGYTLELMYWADNGLVNCGHLALKKLLECPDVDFFTSPTAYSMRSIGDGHSEFNTELESVKLHGKLWFDENDYRTHLCPPDAGFGRTANLKESESIQLRQLSNEILHGAAAWWFDMGGGWYDEPEFMSILKKLNTIAERSINFDRTSAAEIAVVVDEHSLNYTELSSRLTINLLCYQRLQIGRMGAPVDYILLDDLARAKDYKMYIFLDAFRVTPDQKKEIDRLTERGAKALLWVYAPGFIGETLDIRNSEVLTGLKINYVSETQPVEVKMTNEGLTKLSISEKNVCYGMKSTGGQVFFKPAPENVVGPVFYGDDPRAEVLGVLETNGKPGLIRKEINGVQVYYSAAPSVATTVLRSIARQAGVHVYTNENDSFYANRSFIAVSTNNAGPRTFYLPKTTDVFDVYNEKTITTGTDKFTVNLPEKHTVLYFLGSESEWKK